MKLGKRWTSAGIWEPWPQPPRGLSGLTSTCFLVPMCAFRELDDGTFQIWMFLPFAKFMSPDTAVDIQLSDEGHYPASTSRFLVSKLLVGLGGWRHWPPSVLFQIATCSPASGHCSLFIFLGRSLSLDKILGSPMQHTGINCLLRSENLPNYEECMARSHFPELSPTNISPNCHWFPTQLIITTYVALYSANW